MDLWKFQTSWQLSLSIILSLCFFFTFFLYLLILYLIPSNICCPFMFLSKYYTKRNLLSKQKGNKVYMNIFTTFSIITFLLFYLIITNSNGLQILYLFILTSLSVFNSLSFISNQQAYLYFNPYPLSVYISISLYLSLYIYIYICSVEDHGVFSF